MSSRAATRARCSANFFYNRPGDNAPYEVPPFPRDSPLAYDAADEFHVYAFEWEPGIIRWFVDGVQVLESQDPTQVPYLPQQLMMNIWNTNAAWAGPLDPSALPAEAQYDWIRVYQRENTALPFDSFDDGDVSNVFTFSETSGGIGVGPIADASGLPDRALNVGIDPAGAGSYAGVVIAGAPGTMVASGANALTFKLRPGVQAANLPLALEVNLHEDTNGNGAYDGATEDEYQAVYHVAGGSGYIDVTIPLSAFTDDNSVFQGSNDGFDYSKLLEVVVAIVGPTGPGYAISFDEIAFARGTSTAEAPAPLAPEASLRVFPNPALGTTTVAFDLAQTSDVTVDVVDLLGRYVATLARGPQAAGAVRLKIRGGSLAPGTYIVRVRIEAGLATSRLSIAR